MSATGLEVFDKTLQTTNTWLKEIGDHIGPDRQRCYHALRAVLFTLRDRLTPDYQPLCKRQVVSASYYRALRAPNAELVTSAIERITPQGIQTADGREIEVDLLVFATGFQAHNYMRPMKLVGRDGLSIDDAWAKGPRAYRMTAIPGFPNLFTVLGPNSPTGSRRCLIALKLIRPAASFARAAASWCAGSACQTASEAASAFATL